MNMKTNESEHFLGNKKVPKILRPGFLVCVPARSMSHGTEFSNFFPRDVKFIYFYMRYLFLTMKVSLVQAKDFKTKGTHFKSRIKFPVPG